MLSMARSAVKPQIVILGWALAAATATPAAVAQSAAIRDAPAAVADIERTLIDLIGRTEPSVVAISRAASGQSAPAVQGQDDPFGEFRRSAAPEHAASIVGAGVIIDPDGSVLTQYLAAREGDEHTVSTVDGTRYRAAIRGADPRSGLAVLKIDATAGGRQRQDESPSAVPGNFPAIRLGDSSTLRKGQFVVALGNPYAIVSDGQPTASWGMVTNLARKAPVGTNFNDAPGPNNDHRTTLHHLGTLIQTDARLGWNASGGALVNLRGELIGVTTTAATIAGHEQPAGYAIPIDVVMRRVIETLRQGREVEYGMLGVGFSQTIVDKTPQGSSRLSISQVYPGGPAARVGLRPGDIITRVGTQPVDDVDAVQLAISAMPPLTTTTIEYERGGRTATATVTLAKLAVAGKQIAAQRPDAWRGIRVDYATALDAAQLAQAIASGAYDEEGCVLVTEVEPQSAAWRAGVRPGMFISHVGGQRVATPQEFRAAASNVLADGLDIRLTQPAAPNENENQKTSP
jgi:S1-C subfamily serine protease